MTIGLLLAHQLDPAVRPRLAQAAERAGVALRTWEQGQNLRSGEAAPAFIIAPLAAGARRLGPDLVHLADDLYPQARVLLVSRDPLVRPHLELGDGRLVLIDPGASVEDLAERFRIASRWKATPIETVPGPLREVVGDGARALVVRVGEPAGTLLCVPGAGGVIALLGDDPVHPASAPAGLDGALAAWAGHPDHALSRDPVAALLAPWTAVAALGAGGRRWLLGGSGEPAATLIAALRLPAWWCPAPEDRPRQLRAETGDVVLVAGALPDERECSPERLVAVARDGGRALAEHLARRAQAAGVALQAAVLDGAAS